MKAQIRIILSVVPCVLFIVFLIADSKAATECVKSAMTTSIAALIPSLFPYFVLSSFLCGIGLAEALSKSFSKPFTKLFGVSGKGILPFILGFLGGYPTGIKTVCSMYTAGELSENEAQRLLLFTGNTGPAFIIGAAGIGIFSSVKYGVMLYTIHIISAIIIGIICRIIYGDVSETASYSLSSNSKSISHVFTASVSNSINTCISITSFIMLFSLIIGLTDYLGITALLCKFADSMGINPIRFRTIFTGFIEISTGINSLSSFAHNIRFALPAAAFILSWGSISVHCQSLSFISSSNLSYKGYVISKFMHGILSSLFTYVAVNFISYEQVFSFTGHNSPKSFIFDYVGLFFSVLCLFTALIVCTINKKRKAK